jgi:hypothetical protein
MTFGSTFDPFGTASRRGFRADLSDIWVGKVTVWNEPVISYFHKLAPPKRAR